MKDVFKTFKNLDDYFVDSSLLYAKDYGVPQNRPRVFIVGVRNDIRFKANILKPASGLLPSIKDKTLYPHPTDLLETYWILNTKEILKQKNICTNQKPIFNMNCEEIINAIHIAEKVI